MAPENKGWKKSNFTTRRKVLRDPELPALLGAHFQYFATVQLGVKSSLSYTLLSLPAHGYHFNDRFLSFLLVCVLNGVLLSSCFSAEHLRSNLEMKKPGAARSGLYHNTTIDATRAASTTISRVAVKRTFDELHDSKESRGTPSPANHPHIETDLPRQRDFKRPNLRNTNPGALKASEIDNITVQTYSEYSQRRQLALTPTPALNPLLDLSHPAYQLPNQLVENFAALGIKSIYPWQSECLFRSGALARQRNLVYTAPTGGGKSLVADVLMLKNVIQNPEKKALLVLPYVALVQEKLRWLRRIVQGISKETSARESKWPSMWRNRGDENSIRVTGFYGGSKSNATWAEMDIAVCTIEKVRRYKYFRAHGY